jgi:hypothetical protein
MKTTLPRASAIASAFAETAAASSLARRQPDLREQEQRLGVLVHRVGNLDVLERSAPKAPGLRGGPASKRQARGGAFLTHESVHVVKRRPRLRAFQGGLRLLELPDPDEGIDQRGS